jgi:hypothetical protein
MNTLASKSLASLLLGFRATTSRSEYWALRSSPAFKWPAARVVPCRRSRRQTIGRAIPPVSRPLIKPSRPGGGHGKPLNFHKSSGRPGDSQRTNLKSEVSVCLRRLGVPPRPPKRVSSWRAFCGRITVILGRPWCQGTALVPGKPALVPPLFLICA